MRLWSLLAVPVAFVVAACATEGSGRVAPSSDRSTSIAAARSGADDLMAYLAKLRSLPEAGLANEALHRRHAMQKDASDLARIKAALALALASPADDADLSALVEPLAKRDGADTDVRSMASFLQAIAAERRRQRESAAANAVRARDDRRAADTQKQRADALQEKATQLQQKLDALTEIEKSLSDRQGTPR